MHYLFIITFSSFTVAVPVSVSVQKGIATESKSTEIKWNSTCKKSSLSDFSRIASSVQDPCWSVPPASPGPSRSRNWTEHYRCIVSVWQPVRQYRFCLHFWSETHLPHNRYLSFSESIPMLIKSTNQIPAKWYHQVNELISNIFIGHWVYNTQLYFFFEHWEASDMNFCYCC